MRPIEYKADIEYLQALRCVEYRIPAACRLKRPGYVLGLGLRYGLMGIAATYHLLESASGEDERCVLNATRSWPRLVEDHVRYEMINRLPFHGDVTLPVVVGRIAERPLRLALPLINRQEGLEGCMNEVCELFTSENLSTIRMNWPWYGRRSAMQEFLRCSRESLRYAQHFFERRQYDLIEVPEIALLGE